MTDEISDAIESKIINRDNISFSHIRKVAGKNCGVWGELGRGRSILKTCKQLDQYLYSYGIIAKTQWEHVLQNVILPPGNIEIADYGCGQGLASVLLFDTFRDSNLDNISVINLIEPSLVALDRACNILKCYCPDSKIMAVNKVLDDLLETDFQLSEGATKIHLFSNILDITGFDPSNLLNKVLAKKGSHYILAVSHDRSFDGGSERFYNVFNTLIAKKYDDRREAKESIDEFKCGRNKDKTAISFFVKIEI